MGGHHTVTVVFDTCIAGTNRCCPGCSPRVRTWRGQCGNVQGCIASPECPGGGKTSRLPTMQVIFNVQIDCIRSVACTPYIVGTPVSLTTCTTCNLDMFMETIRGHSL